MQFAPAYLLALTYATSTAAHGHFADMPACASSCITTLLPQCAMDPACICHDAAFISTVGCCVKSACTVAEEKSTFKYAAQLCGTFGVNVTQPGPKSCAKGTKGASGVGPKKTRVAQRDFSV